MKKNDINIIDTTVYPKASVFYDELRSCRDRFIVPQIESLIRQFGDAYLTFLEKVLGLASVSGVSPVDAILDYTTAFLREQVRFQQTASYSHDSFDDVYNEVYNNSEVMEGFYLDGLLLTHPCWEIHYHIHRFFLDSFLPRCKGKKQGFEIGFGHGLYLYELLELAGVEKVFGKDISEFSLKYASRLLTQTFSPDRLSLAIGDIQKGLDFSDVSMEFGLMSEVLEHIHGPDQALAAAKRCLRPNSPLYVVTPVNSNAVDHITNFQSVEEIERIVVAAGFTVAEKKIFSIKQFQQDSNDRTETFCAVCTA